MFWMQIPKPYKMNLYLTMEMDILCILKTKSAYKYERPTTEGCLEWGFLKPNEPG